MDVAHVVLSGIVVALGGAMAGKVVTARDLKASLERTNKELKEKLERVEKKLELKVTEFATLPFCVAKHDALNDLLAEKFKNVSDKLDGIHAKINKMNKK